MTSPDSSGRGFSNLTRYECYQLLRPEELSDEELVGILASLDVVISYNNPRSHLLDIFRRVALPLPQRQRSSAKGNPKLINSTETRSSNEPDLFKSIKREQAPINNVDNTKKMKLIDCHRVSSEAMDECGNECVSQVNCRVDSKRDNSKRKLFSDFADHIKRIKITP